MIAQLVVRVRPVAALIRLVLVFSAVLGMSLVPTRQSALLFLAVLGLLLAVTLPAHVGAWLLLGAEVVMWVASYGVAADPPLLRTLAFALCVYATFAATSLAAIVPLGSRVLPDVLRVWAVRSVPGVLSAVVAAAVVGVLGSAPGTRLLDVVGLAAAVVALTGLYLLGRDRW